MRKELGRPTRELFFKRLREVAPDFLATNEHQIKGFTWPFLRQRPGLREWMWFQRAKNDDAFTVELSWTQMFEDPSRPPLGGPDTPFKAEGCRFRLGAFWTGGDYWWHVAKPPSITGGLLALLRAQKPVDVAKHMPRITAAVEDAIHRIQEHALPYFARVNAWAEQNGVPPSER